VRVRRRRSVGEGITQKERGKMRARIVMGTGKRADESDRNFSLLQLRTPETGKVLTAEKK
jgi:hypothetical protein